MGDLGRQNAHTHEHFIFQNALSQFFPPPMIQQVFHERTFVLGKLATYWPNDMLKGNAQIKK